MTSLKIGLRGRLAIAHVYLVFLGLAHILYQKWQPFSDASTLLYPTSLLLTGLAFWCAFSWRRLTGNWFDPYTIFLGAAFLFNGGHAFLEVFGANEVDILWGKFSPETTLNTLIFVILGLSGFHLGAIVSVKNNSEAVRILRNNASSSATYNSASNYYNTRYTTQDLQAVGWLLLLISIIPSIIVLSDAIRTVVQSSYSALYQRDVGTSFEAAPRILSSLLIPGGLFLLASSKGSPFNLFVAVACIVFYSITMLLIGYRGWGVLPLVALAWLWQRIIHPIPRIILVGAAIFIVFIVFPTVRYLRNAPLDERRSIGDFVETFTSIEDPVTAIVSEMGGTMQTISYTIELVPEVRRHDYGGSYIQALSTVIPNFFGDLHPAVKQVLPSRWLTQTVAPWNAERGGGLGYSFIAEAYLNFSWYGVFFLTGIGWLFGRLVRWGDNNSDLAKMAMLATFTSFFSMYARGEAALIVRALIWYSWLPYFLVHLLSAVSSHIRLGRATLT